jgi:hypothetical protein
MTVTPTMRKERNKIEYRFFYTKDPKIDYWRVTTYDGPVKDDCDGYALTLLWGLAGRSWWRFWWLLITFQATIWFVKSYNGDGHAVLWYRGWWADNMEYKWYRTADMRHTRRFPMPWPSVALKLLIGVVVSLFHDQAQHTGEIVTIEQGNNITVRGEIVSRSGSRATVFVDGRLFTGKEIKPA